MSAPQRGWRDPVAGRGRPSATETAEGYGWLYYKIGYLNTVYTYIYHICHIIYIYMVYDIYIYIHIYKSCII